MFRAPPAHKCATAAQVDIAPTDYREIAKVVDAIARMAVLKITERWVRQGAQAAHPVCPYRAGTAAATAWVRGYASTHQD